MMGSRHMDGLSGQRGVLEDPMGRSTATTTRKGDRNREPLVKLRATLDARFQQA
jgi:hypothetical protein